MAQVSKQGFVYVFVAQMLGLREDRVRTMAPEVGGGFGANINIYGEECARRWAVLLSAALGGCAARAIERVVVAGEARLPGSGAPHDVGERCQVDAVVPPQVESFRQVAYLAAQGCRSTAASRERWEPRRPAPGGTVRARRASACRRGSTAPSNAERTCLPAYHADVVGRRRCTSAREPPRRRASAPLESRCECWRRCPGR